MSKSINERFIKLAGRVPIAESLELGQDYTVEIAGQRFHACCVKEEIFDRQDGTVDKVYVVKSTLE